MRDDAQVTVTAEGDPAHRDSRSAVATLRVLFGGSQGVLMSPQRVLAPGTLEIGRDVAAPELASLRGDSSVSRRHALIELPDPPEPPRVTDLDSRNGTFVNGVRVERSNLADGDIIRFGNSILLLRREPAHLAEAPVHGLVGRSPAIRDVRSFVDLVGPTSATVLILGETGVGKSLAARALHDRSGRTGAFVSVNCAAVPETLAESQFFGHVSGAFTGASRDHSGFFRSADGGTLFLDEIAELPPAVQAKLLGALEERAVIPVGSVQRVPCDVRLVAATNADLASGVANRAFRADLYARVSELVLTIAPLRERREDILPLLVSALGEPVPAFSPRLAEALLLYGWPYNVRELHKIANELRIRGGNSERLELDMISERLSVPGPEVPAPAAEPEPAHAAEAERSPMPTRSELEQLLRTEKGMISRIAAITGRSRKQVYRWLAQYELDADHYRDK